jgi:hypothetical protein
LAGAAVALVYLAVKIVLAISHGQLDGVRHEMLPWTPVLAPVVYMVGHGLRSLRLALLIGGWRIGLRLIVSFHFMTAAVGLALPLKLGEVYRVVELSNLSSSLVRAVVIVWWERVFDILAIVVILSVVVIHTSSAGLQEFVGIAGLALTFLMATALTFFVMPDNLRRLSVLIIRRYDSSRTVPVLRMIDLIRHAIQEAPHIVSAKIATLTVLTVLIWACETTCFAIVLSALGGALTVAPDALLSFLSALTRGHTLLGVLNGSEAPTFARDVLPYLAATQIPLVFVSLVATVYYIGQRMQQQR